jgi:hypothetical protein
MAESKIKYSTAQTVTLTLTSLADGSWRQSASVDNGTNLYMDAHIGGIIQTGTSPTSGNTIDIYAYGSYDGTNFTAGASGSDAAYTADGEEDELMFLTSVSVDGTSDQDYVWGPVSVAAAFGGVLPETWGLVVENNTGATLNATGTNNETQFFGITYTSA